MTTPPEPPAQLGLLDLSVDLSVPQVYSGTDFTVYLHIKNPFSVPVWIDKVDMSLPTQLFWRKPEQPEPEPADPVLPEAEAERLTAAVKERRARIRRLTAESGALPPGRAEEARGIEDEIVLLDQANARDQARLDGADDQLHLHAYGGSRVALHGRAQRTHIHAYEDAKVTVFADRPTEQERVPLIGSLPGGTALEPGSTDVWTIRLGTPRTPLFVPASYRLQLNVVYGLAPQTEGPRPGAGGAGPERRRVFANTTALTVPLKAALWNVMTGGAAGGVLGSVGRSLQEAQSLSVLVHRHLGTTIGSLVLAVILSGAAIVFAARKSEAPSFVTVEDFWGGVLVGFLIGYSGTAAFTDLTGLPK
ncbi:hypothetical protein [Kitasatospora sp. NPDC086791]|uniref:hypothetical protein n=1 Tax=Kitasatospora sp. NPDC086791 TaxID=3155178 RepID=UPI003425775A